MGRDLLGFPIHVHMLRHSCGFKLANDGHDRARDQIEAQVRSGADPLAAKDKQHKRAPECNTFGRCAFEFIAAHESGWRNAKHRQQWRNTLQTYCGRYGRAPLIRSLRPTSWHA